jgi:hypothetical protein
MLFRNEGGTGAEPLVLHNRRLQDLVDTARFNWDSLDTSFRRPTLPPSSAPGKLQAKGSKRIAGAAHNLVALAMPLP